jgi:hypothetical protein
MSRGLSVDNEAATTASVVRPALFVELEYESGTVYFNSWDKPIVYDGHTWVGTGNLGKVSSIEESSDAKAQGISLTASGLDVGAVATALGEHYQGRVGRIYIGFLDSSYQLVDDLHLIFQGTMDSQTISLGETGEITVTVENMLADWQRPNRWLYNNADQQSLYPGDRGLEFVEQSTEKEIQWGG